MRPISSSSTQFVGENVYQQVGIITNYDSIWHCLIFLWLLFVFYTRTSGNHNIGNRFLKGLLFTQGCSLLKKKKVYDGAEYEKKTAPSQEVW